MKININEEMAKETMIKSTNKLSMVELENEVNYWINRFGTYKDLPPKIYYRVTKMIFKYERWLEEKREIEAKELFDLNKQNVIGRINWIRDQVTITGSESGGAKSRLRMKITK